VLIPGKRSNRRRGKEKKGRKDSGCSTRGRKRRKYLTIKKVSGFYADDYLEEYAGGNGWKVKR
jgi:hypothetical protein